MARIKTSKQEPTPDAEKYGSHQCFTRAKLKKRGAEVVLGGPSNNTVGDMHADYGALVWDLREISQYICAQQNQGIRVTVEGLRRNFFRTAAVGDDKNPGYATDADLSSCIGNPNFAPGRTAISLMAKAWGLTESSVKTNIKPSRQESKK